MTVKRHAATTTRAKRSPALRGKRKGAAAPRDSTRSDKKTAARRRASQASRARRPTTTPVRTARDGQAAKAPSNSRASRPQERARQRRDALLAVNDDVRRSPQGKGQGRRAKPGKGRKGKKTITIFLHPLAKSLIDGIAYQTGASVQDLGIEAINLLLIAYERKPIA